MVWLQVRMARLAAQAHASGHPMPAAYARMQRWWEALGYPAFIAMVAVYGLMVNKPPLWAGQ